MQLTHSFGRRALLALVLCAFAAASAVAQEYPSQPVRWIVPYAPGSSTDTLTRLIGEGLSKRIKQPVVVENKPGAGGMIAAKFVSESVPNGNTILTYSTAWPSQPIFVKTPLIPVPDALQPVTMLVDGKLVLAAPAALPFKSLAEFATYAKANAGKLNFGTTGPGDPLLHFETLRSDLGIDMVHVQYKGAGPQMLALLANEVQLAFPPEFTTEPYVKSGKLRVLAVTGDQRSRIFPDAPTFAELGYPKIRNFWQAAFAPKGTPQRIIDRLNADLVAVVKSPEVQRQLLELYLNPIGSTPEVLRDRIQQDTREWTETARSAGIKPQ